MVDKILSSVIKYLEVNKRHKLLSFFKLAFLNNSKKVVHRIM